MLEVTSSLKPMFCKLLDLEGIVKER